MEVSIVTSHAVNFYKILFLTEKFQICKQRGELSGIGVRISDSGLLASQSEGAMLSGWVKMRNLGG